MYKSTLLFLASVPLLHAAELNVANASKHPYADVKQGREDYRFADKKTNEVRLYDFYQRQADYYMDPANEVPAIIPAYPGLDGGSHGHWGKHNQNNYKDPRWNAMGQSQFWGQEMDNVITDSVSVLVDSEQKLYTAFSPKTNLSFYRFWSGSQPVFNPTRWGIGRGVTLKGKASFGSNGKTIKLAYDRSKPSKAVVGWLVDRSKQEYLGMYDSQGVSVFAYKLDGSEVLDAVQGLPNGVYQRTLEFVSDFEGAEVALFDIKGKSLKVSDGIATGLLADGKTKFAVRTQAAGENIFKAKGNTLVLSIAKQLAGSGMNIFMSADKKALGDKLVAAEKGAKKVRLSELVKKPKSRWSDDMQNLAVTKAKDDAAYVIDDFDIPLENKNNSMLFLSGIDFNKDGAAFISTLMGEVYKVTGLTGSQTKWQKIATGLNQPLGLQVWDEKVYVLEREQITELQDLDGDGETDFYSNFSNTFPTQMGSHTHTYGLERDADGNIYFVSGITGYRLSPDGKEYTALSTGIRNGMGFGSMSDGTILVGPQEGTSTPASAILELKEGDNHGFKNREALSVPLGYVPRGIDNSTGGFLEVEDTRWGPLGDKGLVSVCYGYGSWYQILFDKSFSKEQTRQIATVPMKGEFASGVLRAAVNPVDGQVYTVGLDGWGDYALADGCLHRIRYTGKPMYEPLGFATSDNGITVHFENELDAAAVKDVKHYFAQMWDYNHTKQYGSPEFSLKEPKSLGHDPLNVKSAHLLADKKSIFVEIPDLQPAMQMHLRMHLKTANGTEFKTDLFPTILNLGEYKEFEGAAPKMDKNREFVLRSDRVEGEIENLDTQSGEQDDHAKKVVVSTPPGLKFDKTSFKVKAGESVALVLKNADVMPHNLVIVKPGKKQAVGEAAFKMLSDPEALKKSYVPDDKSDVIAFTFVVDPKGSHTTYFTAPEQKGEYPYICTFPGHWQVMQGKMIVE
ncbi:plastocyanin/azurin family copper-binding protein [Rubritalea spongiae]|uniref:Plastocyanin/azurin family copper-binding protein n=1 Tax=Rubritalea spongiae TaxID=430797 RepID=A0ABW5DZB0_9BACT